MKLKFLTLLFLVACSYSSYAQNEEKAINALLDDWHKAAADANFVAYFEKMADQSIFIGTDAGEVWNKTQFMAYAKPYFNAGKAWSFLALKRNIYFNEQHTIAWFDELLDTQMKLCRGSGVLEKINGKWLIKHYVLSMTIPNENAKEVINTKSKLEDQLLNELKENKKAGN